MTGKMKSARDAAYYREIMQAAVEKAGEQVALAGTYAEDGAYLSAGRHLRFAADEFEAAGKAKTAMLEELTK